MFMKIFGMGIPELLIILAVILLIFGPRNLPKLGSAIGRTVKNLRSGLGSRNKDNGEAANEIEAEGTEEEPSTEAEVEVVAAEEAPAPKPVKKVVVKKAAAK